MRYLIALIVSAVTVVMLAACSSSISGPVAQSAGSGTPAPAPMNDAVTGSVSWADGQPAAGASVYFHANGWTGWYVVGNLPTDGSYSLGGCPCGDLTAYLRVPSAVMRPANGGLDCWIILQDDSGIFSGRLADPGDVVNWEALDLPCSPTRYASDPRTVRAETSTVLPSRNSGPWQTAEQLTGGGSGGVSGSGGPSS